MTTILIIILALVSLHQTAWAVLVPGAMCWNPVDFHRVLAFFAVLGLLQHHLDRVIARFRKTPPTATVVDGVEFLGNAAGEYMLALRKKEEKV